MNTFGQRLRDARKQAKLSQAAAAKKVGMSQSQLSDLENNAYPTSGFTPRLAYAYKVSARWLADGHGPRDIPAAEALGDEDVMLLWNKYTQATDATKKIIDFLLQENNEKRPEWMSPALAAMIENARLLVAEQFPSARDLKSYPTGTDPKIGSW